MIRTRYWLLTLFFAAAVHAGALGLVMQDETMTESDPFVGQQISINLVLASMPPKPVPQPVVEQAVEPEPVVEKPVVEEPVVEEEVVEEVVEAITDEPAEVVAKKPVEKPEPKPVKKEVEKPPVEKKPEPKPEPKPAVVKTPSEPTPVEKPPVETQTVAEVETSETSDAYRKGNSDTQQVSVKGGAQASAEMAYISHLKRELAKHKRYPKKALFRHHQGTTSVWLRLNSEGKLVDYEIVESSGYNTLDKEVVKMLKRVGDLPPFPDDMQKSHLDIQVPITFNLRG